VESVAIGFIFILLVLYVLSGGPGGNDRWKGTMD